MNTLELYRSGKQFGWRYRAGNGKIVAQGERYRRKATMLRTLDDLFGVVSMEYLSVWRNATQIARIVDLTTGQPQPRSAR
jgi:uncharacterized protein YegP (UPF0339 family)